ncbi:MAG: lantibiotic dehydratase [Bacteroidetes bacterium]|nr:lantibiotic dehydratase [Bacteroidota bacterium]
MNYAFFPSLIARAPVFSFQDYPSIDYASLLKQDFFLSALYIASPEFYEVLEKKNFDYESLKPAEKNTLRKYYNRACYRPVPFGAFSAVSPVSWTTSLQLPSFIEQQLNVHFRVDYVSGLALYKKVVEQDARDRLLYQPNSSMYRVHENIRYIKYHTEERRAGRRFSVSSLTVDRVVDALLEYCAPGRRLPEIAAFLAELTGSSEEDTEAYIAQLVAEQIILPQTGMNVTGADCLETLTEVLSTKEVSVPELQQVNSILAMLKPGNGPALGQVPMYGRQVRQLLGGGAEGAGGGGAGGRHPFYVVSERNQAAGGVPVKYQEAILEALHCLDRLLPYYRNEALDNFVNAFSARFGDRELPLLFALDPEVGVGYENLESGFAQHSLMNDVQFDNAHDQHEKYVKWTPAHALLLNKIQRHHLDRGYYEIEITREDIADMEPDSTLYKLPPSLSVLFRIAGEKVVIETAGGASAASLIGRFSPFSGELHQMAKEIADKEQALNRDIVFAEIAHATESHTDNINRREHIRDYEIPVMVMSTMDSSARIDISDLYISVNDRTLVLRSKKLNALVVPRLSSAFNYVHGELAVFRFLCDLQQQGIKVSFRLDLEEMFPDLSFYPRIVYRSAILCLAKWRLSAKDVSFLREAPASDYYSHFNKLADILGLPNHFALVENDNHLVFDRSSEEDILLFLDTVKNYQKISLSEYLLEAGESLLSDRKDSRPLICQYMAPLFLRENVYGPSSSRGFDEKDVVSRSFLPGTEWLYFKIYCHPSWSNELLQDILLPLLDKAVKWDAIDKWFFVRYNDPNYHIRLRLHIKGKSPGNLMSLFSSKLKKLLDEGIIERYYVDTYIRELERYTPALMADVETFFYYSSHLLLWYFRYFARRTALYPYHLDVIVLSIDTILDAFSFKIEERVALFKTLYESMLQEFGNGKELKKSLDKKYASLRGEINALCENPFLLKKSRFRQLCGQLRDSAALIAEKLRKKPVTSKEKLLSDMLHMHLNRVFTDNPRKQEMIVYFLLHKHYSALYYKAKSGAG